MSRALLDDEPLRRRPGDALIYISIYNAFMPARRPRDICKCAPPLAHFAHSPFYESPLSSRTFPFAMLVQPHEFPPQIVASCLSKIFKEGLTAGAEVMAMSTAADDDI